VKGSKTLVGLRFDRLIDFAASASMANADIAKTVTHQERTASFKSVPALIRWGESVRSWMCALSKMTVPLFRFAIWVKTAGSDGCLERGEQKLRPGEIELVLTIGSKTYTVNGVERTADVAPEIVNSRTFLPARYVAETFGATVGWDAAAYTVTIQR
jgi:hypothetical protein